MTECPRCGSPDPGSRWNGCAEHAHEYHEPAYVPPPEPQVVDLEVHVDKRPEAVDVDGELQEVDAPPSLTPEEETELGDPEALERSRLDEEARYWHERERDDAARGVTP